MFFFEASLLRDPCFVKNAFSLLLNVHTPHIPLFDHLLTIQEWTTAVTEFSECEIKANLLEEKRNKLFWCVEDKSNPLTTTYRYQSNYITLVNQLTLVEFEQDAY